MIITADIGNSNIVIGILNDKKELVFMARTVTAKNENDEYFYKTIKNTLEENEAPVNEVKGAILSSVVPEITDKVKKALDDITDTETVIANQDLKTGIKVMTENRKQLGNDLLVDAVAAVNQHDGDIIIFDMGTATTCSVVNKSREYLGTIIIPGVAISYQALSDKASQLPKIEFKAPKNLIGRNTVECMQSGLVYSNAAMVDGIIDRVEEVLGSNATVIATGGIAGLIVPFCKKKIIYDPDLLLKGLYDLYVMNK